MRGSAYVLEGDIPTARVHELQQRLASLTRGEGTLENAVYRYEPVIGAFPTRSRTDHDPLNRGVPAARRAEGRASYQIVVMG